MIHDSLSEHVVVK